MSLLQGLDRFGLSGGGGGGIKFDKEKPFQVFAGKGDTYSREAGTKINNEGVMAHWLDNNNIPHYKIHVSKNGIQISSWGFDNHLGACKVNKIDNHFLISNTDYDIVHLDENGSYVNSNPSATIGSHRTDTAPSETTDYFSCTASQVYKFPLSTMSDGTMIYSIDTATYGSIYFLESDYNSNLYFITSTGYLYKIDYAGTLTFRVDLTELSDPPVSFELVDDKIFITTGGTTDSVYIYNMDGTHVATITGFSYIPYGVASYNGHYYFVDRTYYIRKYDKNFAFVSNLDFSDGGYKPLFAINSSPNGKYMCFNADDTSASYYPDKAYGYVNI
jgi:hypothetical protein